MRRVTRRDFVVGSSGSLALAAGAASAAAFEGPAPRQATGTRVGEVSERSAVVWTRITAEPSRNDAGIVIPGRAQDYKGKALPTPTVPVDRLEGACPGAPGRVRLRYAPKSSAERAGTVWAKVDESTDFIHKFVLTGLRPGTAYVFESETVGPDGEVHGVLRGAFRTAPAPDAPTDETFCVMTCQGYPDRGHRDGHAVYPAMLALDPAFACLTGDFVYYDNDMPRATSPRLARYHWERMFSLPRLVEFNRMVAAYWLKDDHDTLDNDSWPGASMGSFTFAEGQRIFRRQAPMGDGPSHRTFRRGRDLQVWFTDGRDFRSPNNLQDGPAKTIRGAEQKAWFKKTVAESDATWKVLVSPTPLVGPDRGRKNDNHANAGFAHEGDELRAWLKAHAPDNFFVICGDRHWQYHSVHPSTGLREFGVGAASDEHAGGSPGLDPAYHKFHRVKGGFLSVAVKGGDRSALVMVRHHDVNGAMVHEWTADRARG